MSDKDYFRNELLNALKIHMILNNLAGDDISPNFVASFFREHYPNIGLTSNDVVWLSDNALIGV